VTLLNVLRRDQLLTVAASAGLCVLLGATAAINGQVSLALFALALGAMAAARPAVGWVGAALIAALTFKGLTTLGFLPSIATFMDIPLAWGALAVALLKRPRLDDFARRHLRLLAILAFAVLASWLMHPSELLRPMLYLGLIGEPFAVIGALVADPPSPRAHRALLHLLAALIAIQVPFALFELWRFGSADHVQGTLYGAGAGAHVMSAVVLVGALWAFSSRSGGVAWRRALIVAILLVIPFVADAKQVLFALPAVLFAMRFRGQIAIYLTRAVVIGGVFAALLYIYPAGRTALIFVHQSENGRGGKEAAASLVWSTIASDPQSLVFGKGPAETVSRAAFMTTNLAQRQDSQLRVLRLKPAAIAMEAQYYAIAESHGGTSFNSGLSSALGVVGDLGLAGAAAYAALFVRVFAALRKRRSPEAVAAACGWAMWVVLGVVFDWWEQPPFSLVLGVLSGLALAQTAPDAAESR
jgi:hypothetical protein